MKRSIAFVIMVSFLLAVGLVQAKEYEITKKAGDYTVQVKIDRNPPVTGKNNLILTIKNNAGKEVVDAVVAIDYGMPAMSGMPAMNYKTNATSQGNLYHAILDFSMSGAWFVNIKITKAGKTQTVKLNVDIK